MSDRPPSDPTRRGEYSSDWHDCRIGGLLSRLPLIAKQELNSRISINIRQSHQQQQRATLKEQLVAIGDTEGEIPPLETTTSPPRGQYVHVREQALMETNLAHGDSTGNHPIPYKSGKMVAEDASYIHMVLYQDREAHFLTKIYENARRIPPFSD